MATRSFIGVVVNPQDKGKFIEPNIVLLGKGISSDFDEPEFHRTTIENTTEVIRIYHHWDGYPEGVGDTLLSEFNTYEKALNLMSGGYDFGVTVEGKNIREISLFVSEHLAPMESVLSTATHFVLRCFKEDGVIFPIENEDDREVISL